MIPDQAQAAAGRVLVERQHRDRRRQRSGELASARIARDVLELHHGEHRAALDARHRRIGEREQRHAVGAVGEELPLATGNGTVDQRAVGDVVAAAGDGLAAAAIGHAIAGDEEGVVGEPEGTASAVGEAYLQPGADRGRRHRGRVGESGCVHRREADAADRDAAACRPGRAGRERGQRQHRRAGQQLQRASSVDPVARHRCQQLEFRNGNARMLPDPRAVCRSGRDLGIMTASVFRLPPRR